MPSPTAPRDLATSGRYPFARFGTAADRAHDVELAAAQQMAAIAQFVKRELTVQDLTQQTLARRAGVSQAALSDLVRGASWTRGAVVARVVAALGGDVRIHSQTSGRS